ncbi:MAG: hypothetical protein ACR2MX_03440 [Cyclobacteriaceae bacterium]
MYKSTLLVLLIGLPFLCPAQDVKETYFVISMESEKAMFFTLLTSNVNITDNQSFEDWFWDDFQKRNKRKGKLKIEEVRVIGPFAHQKDADKEIKELLAFQQEKATVMDHSTSFFVQEVRFVDRSLTTLN